MSCVSEVGYNVYMCEVKSRVINDITRKPNVTKKPTKQALTNEITKRWLLLPDPSKNYYKNKAVK